MAWIIQSALAAMWALVEPLLISGLLAAAAVAFVLGVMAMLPLPRFRAITFFLAAAGALGGAGFLYGQKVASRDAEIAAARAQIAAMERDVAIARSAEADAAIRAEAQTAYAKSLETQVTDYEQALAARPDAACTLGNDDLERLRRIGR